MRWVILGIGVLFLYLSCRLFYIQVANSEEYQKRLLHNGFGIRRSQLPGEE